MARAASKTRTTKETDITLALCLDGGAVDIATGIGFFDHMLNAFATHGGFGLTLRVQGDLHVDCHHTVEDVGIVLGDAFWDALGDKRGIERFAERSIPMDEALATCVVDVGGRPYLSYRAEMKQDRIGDYDACMTVEFLRAFCDHAKVTLHTSCTGDNAHHMTEAIFKALARALRDACRITGDALPSTKGVL